MPNEKVKLMDNDWKDLLPSKEVAIASQKIIVEPLGFKNFTLIINRFKDIQGELTTAGIDIAQLKDSPGSMITLTSLILEKMPELISLSCNLDAEDIDRIPINTAIQIVEAIIDVNIESQNGFLKNLTALAGKTSQLMEQEGSEI